MSTDDRTRDPLGLGPLRGLDDQAIRLANQLDATTDENVRLREENRRLREALAFAASTIKSGESWSPTCDEVIGGALGYER